MDLLILQPTPFCNLDCSYCYLPFRSDRSRMTLETVRASASFVEKLSVGQEEIEVVWHSGEPLVVPPEWYREAHACLSDVLGAERLLLNFQTNATLISERWIRFFQEDPRIRLSLSIDGPASLHDARRKNRNGRGSHARIMEGVRRLRDAEIPFGCIAVVTAQALAMADELFDFFVSIGARQVAFNPEEQDGSNSTTSMDGQETEAAYRQFLCRIAERWLAERPFEIREIDRIDAMIDRVRAGGSGVETNQQTEAWRLVSVNWKGDVHTFSPELLDADLPAVGRALGNVHRDTVASISKSESFRQLTRRINRGRQQCREVCSHFFICGGGAPANKWAEHGAFEGTETRYCRFATRIPVDAYLSVLEARTR